MKLKTKIAVLFMGISILAHSNIVIAAPKSATCQIDENGRTAFKGKCTFIPSAGGSFTLMSQSPNKPLFRNIMDVSVYITERNHAEVRGSLSGGHNSRWGEATRSQNQKACWVGSDFKVCAW